ncbi:MAG: hypothetical protein JWM95_925 [Gemmatimonadetes bacterium]|nr:hypothetical protein [Gemmatimonadota bacterium]
MFVSAAWIVPAAFGALNRVAQSKLNGWDPVTLSDLIWSGGDWFLYAFLTPAVFAVSARWPITRTNLWRRVWLHVAISLLFCVAWATTGKLLQLMLGIVFEPAKIHAALAAQGDVRVKIMVDWIAWIFTTLPFGVAVYLCIVGVEHATRYFIEVSEREVQVARLSGQLADARFSALQAQLNPHFLFNTLNTIAVRARDGDGAGTAQMVEQLSDVLRQTLDRNRVNEVPLSDELDLVRQYLAIEQARFSDRLRSVFDVGRGVMNAAVPSFAVQHLVENAIRHGIAKRSGAGRLEITARHVGDILEIIVRDDGAGLQTSTPAPGHGIDNTRARLAALYGTRASLVVLNGADVGTVATLRVPFHDVSMESDVAER